MTPTVGFYPRYDRLGASSRLRFGLFFDRWRNGAEEGACRLAMHPGLSDAYLSELYAGKCSVYRKFLEWLRLWRRVGTLEDNLVIEYELLPGVPYCVERLFLRGRRYILNFDDNVWEKYRGRPLLADKFDRLAQHASGVIVANGFLYDKLRPLQPNLCLVPTVVDLDSYPAGTEKYPVFTVVWIGTPVTYCYLEQFLPALRAMSRRVDFELLVVARRELAARPLPGVKTRYLDWSEEREAEVLTRSHVGIMPLPDDAFARGKSAYKLIQYQAAGLPSLASPVGENRRVVRHGENGFLVDAPEEWAERLCCLYEDRTLYRACARAARNNAYNNSLQKYFPIYCDFIRKNLQV